MQNVAEPGESQDKSGEPTLVFDDEDGQERQNNNARECQRVGEGLQAAYGSW